MVPVTFCTGMIIDSLRLVGKVPDLKLFVTSVKISPIFQHYQSKTGH